ncbi:MAG TPA: hypothetical protein DCL81_15190 [Algoriphagus sp.]|jgi:hypothetical protein|uniref:hypothetical protein n=1 Tax=Algoriphagus sp. TaxID=1872435 RepID=UPI000C3E424E|nr:hypothetical protein [Algoriphagus sp.]MAL13375.1 hypothetical protein [Algoriphagus sp.]MAN85557.1 hypothetical protein [Algoriphagus sp.]HAH37798.1 hypothetical protein [Algoriphagus sp.]HAS58508.1 hypothetical protein [Algoriphagus sp.]HCX77510.1 hypothetical protein [Algoriphagus sp.]|tara:strand:+ start:8524 stop:9048 length:525 start_codon:yes stop_codon:yes gene_type:complete
MPKFVALFGIKNLSVPFIERDEEGKILRDETITFNKGQNGGRVFVPAFFYTNDPEKIKHLRNYPGNKKNGGCSFEEVEEAKNEIKAAKAPEKPVKPAADPTPDPAADPTPDPTPDPKNEVVIPEGFQSFPEITTVNEASAKLRELFEDVTSKDTRNKKQVQEVAASKQVIFPNL